MKIGFLLYAAGIGGDERGLRLEENHIEEADRVDDTDPISLCIQSGRRQ